MFKELEHRTQFGNLVQYNEVTDLDVLYIHASFYRCFLGRTGSLLSALGASGVKSNTNKGA
jgi:hypothetical protein